MQLVQGSPAFLLERRALTLESTGLNAETILRLA